MPQVSTKVATIAASASLSDAINTGGGLPVAIQMPAAWTSAALTFQGSMDGSTYQSIYCSDGTEYSIVAAVATNVAGFDSSIFVGFNYIKIRSGTAGSPVTQGAERGLIIAFL